jgi:predicted dehydrogenase
MTGQNRRTFLWQGGVGLAAAATQASAAPKAQTLTLAAIGVGGQGMNLLRQFVGRPGVEIAYVCDPDETRRLTAATAIQVATGKAPKAVADFRTALDDRSIDAVVIATPDHWHAPAAILACDAGKHVYVEKPCSHNIREGRLLVEAARRSGKVVQHGTQSRSMPLVRHAIRLLQERAIGDVLVAKAFNIQRRADIGRARPGDPPKGFDYDLWLGPAPAVPFQSNRHHYTWHWWYDFGTGDMGNDGVHELDIARWGLGVEGHPSSVSAAGGKLFFDDDQQFPDTQFVTFDYPGEARTRTHRQLVFEMRIWSPYQPDEGVENGNLFYGTDGWMLVSKRGVLKLFDAKGKPRPVPGQPDPSPSHQENFVAAVRGEAPSNAPIEVGHVSAALCHLGNIATRLGRSLRFEPKAESVIGDDEAQALTSRAYRADHWAIPKGV